MNLTAAGSGGANHIVPVKSLFHCGDLRLPIYATVLMCIILSMLFLPIINSKRKHNSSSDIPGDEWVDMVGMDNYGDMGRNRYDLDTAALKLKIVSDYAKKSGKLAAFTETGLESIPNTTWWTGTLLNVMRKHKLQLAYVLVWRNDIRSATHYYAPFPGQVSVPDFMTFYADPYTLFENDLKNIYGRRK